MTKKKSSNDPVHVKFQIRLSLWGRVKVFLGARQHVVVGIGKKAKGRGKGKEEASAIVTVGPLFGRKRPE